MIDLQSLTYEQFEYFVGRLLIAEGFRLKAASWQMNGLSGWQPDFVLEDEDGKEVVVEVKHFRQQRKLPSALVDRFLEDIERYLNLSSTSQFMLICSSKLELPSAAKRPLLDRILVLDTTWLALAANRHPDIVNELESAIGSLNALAKPLVTQLAATQKVENPLISELMAIPAGKECWKQYENIGAKLLSHIFLDALAPPDLQTRSDDGLDIMDAIFPIRAESPKWERLRADCQTRFVVVEFKNHQASPGQREVESLQQYLFAKAKRTFGILCCRQPPNESALTQRRRAWVEQEKLIVFLTDQDLGEMVQYRSEGGDPVDVIDAQVEKFFLTLSP